MKYLLILSIFLMSPDLRASMCNVDNESIINPSAATLLWSQGRIVTVDKNTGCALVLSLKPLKIHLQVKVSDKDDNLKILSDKKSGFIFHNSSKKTISYFDYGNRKMSLLLDLNKKESCSENSVKTIHCFVQRRISDYNPVKDIAFLKSHLILALNDRLLIFKIVDGVIKSVNDSGYHYSFREIESIKVLPSYHAILIEEGNFDNPLFSCYLFHGEQSFGSQQFLYRVNPSQPYRFKGIPQKETHSFEAPDRSRSAIKYIDGNPTLDMSSFMEAPSVKTLFALHPEKKLFVNQVGEILTLVNFEKKAEIPLTHLDSLKRILWGHSKIVFQYQNGHLDIYSKYLALDSWEGTLLKSDDEVFHYGEDQFFIISKNKSLRNSFVEIGEKGE